MGNDSSTNITIKFDQSNSSFFTGDIVSGIVNLDLDEELKFHEIFITLKGGISYTRGRIMSNTKGTFYSTIDYHHVPIFSTTIFFVRSHKEEEEFIYNRGQYSWPFQIQLSDYLPPTINDPHDYPHVKYYLKLVITKPWYKQNIIHTQYLTIYPRVNILENPSCLLMTTFCNYNRQDIMLKVVLNKLGYVPGEIMVITLEINNPKRFLIKYIDLSMIKYNQIAANTQCYSVFRVILPKIINLTNEQMKEVFYLVIPTIPLPPSYQYSGGIGRTTNVNVGYSLKFKVKIKGLFANFDVIVPIILGTEPKLDIDQQQVLDPSGYFISFDPGKGMFKDDSIPSYDLFFHPTESSRS